MRYSALISLVILVRLVAVPSNTSPPLENAQSDAATTGARSTTPTGVLKTTICEVVASPDSFDGRMIELRARVFAGLEANLVYDKTCRSDDGLLARIPFTTVDNPKPGRENIPLKEDKEYRRFWNLVHAYKEPPEKRNTIMPDKYTVTATFVGRYDVVKPSVPGTGFHGQLVVKSIRDVVAGPPESIF